MDENYMDIGFGGTLRKSEELSPPPKKNGAVINKAIPSFLSPNCRIPVLASAYFEVRVQFLLLPPPTFF